MAPKHEVFAGLAAEVMAEVPGFKVTRVSLAEGQKVDWFTADHAHTSIFACDDALILQLKVPPIRWPLRAGEVYTVPPHMELTVMSEGGGPTTFVALQYGDSLVTRAVEPPESQFTFGRSLPEPTDLGPRPVGMDEALSQYHHALRRMDILAIQPQLRVVVQAHGPYECVPWHTHDNVADTFLAMDGYVQLAVKDPDEIIILAPGEIYSVVAKRPHFVSSVGSAECTVMVLQGVGFYNYKAYLGDMRGAVEGMILR